MVNYMYKTIQRMEAEIVLKNMIVVADLFLHVCLFEQCQ